MLRVSETEAAYLAGFFDGEGSIGVYGYSLRITIAQKDPTVLYELKELFGGGVTKGRLVYNWWSNGAVARAFIDTVRPYLRVKKARVEELYPTPKNPEDLEAFYAQRSRYVLACQEALELVASGVSRSAAALQVSLKYEVKSNHAQHWLYQGARPRGWKEAQVVEGL